MRRRQWNVWKFGSWKLVFLLVESECALARVWLIPDAPRVALAIRVGTAERPGVSEAGRTAAKAREKAKHRKRRNSSGLLALQRLLHGNPASPPAHNTTSEEEREKNQIVVLWKTVKDRVGREISATRTLVGLEDVARSR